MVSGGPMNKWILLSRRNCCTDASSRDECPPDKTTTGFSISSYMSKSVKHFEESQQRMIINNKYIYKVFHTCG